MGDEIFFGPNNREKHGENMGHLPAISFSYGHLPVITD
jgi:hypothetical protein